jgi:hypothetical protein
MPALAGCTPWQAEPKSAKIVLPCSASDDPEASCSEGAAAVGGSGGPIFPFIENSYR